MSDTSSKPLVFPSADAGYLFRSTDEAALFDRTIAAQGLTEKTVAQAFGDLDGPTILTRLMTGVRTESHERKIGRPATAGQRFLVDLYRVHALAQGKRNVVKQIDHFLDTEGVIADMARWSSVLEGLKRSGVVLPDREQQDADAAAQAAADVTLSGEESQTADDDPLS